MEQKAAFAAFVGIDWADKKHDICLCARGEERRERLVLEHRAAAIHAWADNLRARFGGAPVAVCIELSHGPLVTALLEHDFIVVFPVQPTTLARYRIAFNPSGAKDDPTDAELALEILLRHPEKLTRYRPDSPEVRVLRQLVETRRRLVEDRVRITNRIVQALKAYFPLVLEWFREKDSPVFADFIERWPTLESAQRAKRETLVRFFHRANVRRAATIARRLDSLSAERPLHGDLAVIEPMRLLVASLLPQLRVVVLAIKRFDDEIRSRFVTIPDHRLFASLPGAGATMGPRLLAAFGTRRERFPTASALQKYAGVAPVVERSGNKSWVHWRVACSKFVRQTFVEWAGLSIRKSFWAKAFYDRARARGLRHQAALRALAFKWIRILHRCWTDRVAYDESRYLSALRKRHAPLLQFAATASS